MLANLIGALAQFKAEPTARPGLLNGAEREASAVSEYNRLSTLSQESRCGGLQTPWSASAAWEFLENAPFQKRGERTDTAGNESVFPTFCT